jgi:hypothetical protein
VEPRVGRALQPSRFPEEVRGGKGAMPAELQLGGGGKPSQTPIPFLAGNEGRCCLLHLCGESLVQGIGSAAGEHADSGGVSAEGCVSEGINDPEF